MISCKRALWFTGVIFVLCALTFVLLTQPAGDVPQQALLRIADISLSINHQINARIPPGRPILIEAVLTPTRGTGGGQAEIVNSAGDWADLLALEVRDSGMAIHTWPFQTVRKPKPEGSILDFREHGRGVAGWVISPPEIAGMMPGHYTLTAFLKDGQGNLLAQSGPYTIEVLPEAAEESPEAAKKTALLLAEYYYFLEEKDKALQVLDAYLAEHAVDLDGMEMKVRILLDQGKDDEAMELYSRMAASRDVNLP